MRISALFCVSVFAMTLPAMAETVVIEDFESYTIGTKFSLVNTSGSTSSAGTAVVEADPNGSDNNVLHVKTTNWNVLVSIPMTITGTTASTYDMMSYRLYRSDSDASQYKKFLLYFGNSKSYESGSYDSQGTEGWWQLKSYFTSKVTNSSKSLALGFSHASDVYIDDVIICNPEYGYDNADETTTIRYYADKLGFQFGMATSPEEVTESNIIPKTIYSNFNATVAGNAMKFDATEPSRNSFSYTNADKLVKFAASHDMVMRGHTLCWHSQLPTWVSADGKNNDKGWTKEELLAILKNHIYNVVGHYKGKVAEWDVVNECLDDDQSIIATKSTKYTLRKESVWTKVCGECFLDSAFKWAHEADPDAILILNDYGVEQWSGYKAQALYNLAVALKKRGAPIDGVGLQSHLTTGKVDSLEVVKTFVKYKYKDLKVRITELDLAIPSSDWGTASAWKTQAQNYRMLTNIALDKENSLGVIVWGLSDKGSWINTATSGEPLMLDHYYQAKPAFYYVRATLKQRYEKLVASNIETVFNPDPEERVDVYDLTGRRVATGVRPRDVMNLPAGLYIMGNRKVLVK